MTDGDRQDVSILTAAINESDVEHKVVYPLLTGLAFLAIPPDLIKPKSYLAPTSLDKEAGRTTGYFPDYSVWMLGVPVLIVEAKEPAVSSQIGFREACLYARHLNSRYSTDFNPCRFVIATNGVNLLAGYWDQEAAALDLSVADFSIGTKATQDLLTLCHVSVLREHSRRCQTKLRMGRGTRPFQLVGGQAILNAKCPLNTFAADLSPILRRYFSSTSGENNREIAERAYVSSGEITEYDRILEAMLKDRVSPRRDTIVQPIRTSKHDEPSLTKAIQEHSVGDRSSGQLQLIQGPVGAGKSLFARRYRDLLEPAEMKTINYWAFVDFNNSPTSLKGAEQWLCAAFVESFERENRGVDLYASAVVSG